MPNPLVSEIQSKQGDVFDIAAKRFSGNRTVTMTGDVTGSESGWNGSGELSIPTTIANNAVTTQKIADKAVTTSKIDDGAVGLTQIDSNAMNGTVQDNDSNLATHAAVKTYVDSQISGQGTYLGKHTVAEINAFTTSDLHNGDRVMVSDSGTINLGPGGAGFDVVAGEDLILYKSGSTVQWDSMDGNFKTKQTAVTKTGSALKTITSLTQNANGEINATFSDIQDGTTSQKGVVQLKGSIDASESDNANAATPKAVRDAINDLDVIDSAVAGQVVSSVSEVDGKVVVGRQSLIYTDIPVGTKYDQVVTNETDSTPIKLYEISEIGLSSDYKAATAELTVYQRGTNSAYEDNTSYKVSIHWSRTRADVIISGVSIKGTWTAVVVNSSTPASTDVSTLKIYFTPSNYRTFYINFNSCGIRGQGTILNGTIDKTNVREAIPTASELVIIGTTKAFNIIKQIDGLGAGSASVPVYVNNNGAVVPCTGDFDLKEDLANKVTSWSSTPTDKNYPSEKLVFDSLADKMPFISGGVCAIQMRKKLTANWYNGYTFTILSGHTCYPNIFEFGFRCTAATQDTPVPGDVYRACISIGTGTPSSNGAPAFYYKVDGEYVDLLLVLNASEGYSSVVIPGNGMRTVDFTILSSMSGIDLSTWTIKPWADGGTTNQWVVRRTTDSYSSTGSAPVSGKGVAEALATLDAEQTSTDGTNVQFKVTEVDGKITEVNVTTDNTASKVASATSGNFAGLGANGDLTDSGSKASDFATAAQGTAADSAVQDVQIGNTSIVSNHVATLPSAAAGTKGVVEYMTSQEAASLWTNAWAAAT